MKHCGLWIILFLVAGSFSLTRCSRQSSEFIDTVASPLRSVVANVKIVTPYYAQKVRHKTASYYEGDLYRKAWLGRKNPNRNYKAFVSEVMESSRYGMNPDDYNIGEIKKEVEALYNNKDRKEAEVSALDIKITASFFLFTTHLLEGRIQRAGASDFIWKKDTPHEDDVAMLLNIESAADLRQEINKLHPDEPQYEMLRKALKDYKEFAEKDKLPMVRVKGKIQPGESHQSIPLIRKKLQLTGIADQKETGDSLSYETSLVEAVKKFQSTHGLDPSGIINQETVRYLNMSLRHKAELIALGLERLRWMPRISFEGDQLIVNIPDYRLQLYRDTKKIMEMKVILGDEYNSTPIFQDTLKYIVFSPTWNVPQSIFEEEFLPNLKENPSYYSENFIFRKDGAEIDPAEEDWNDKKIDVKKYQAIQNPGNMNALGNVKFVMPNNFNVYLHDTPHDGLFERKERALSHGCVRLEKPLELAEYLLRDQKGWDQKAIAEAMKGEEPKTVLLKKPYPVHIVYRSVWVDDDGNVNFRDDIYGHDERQLAQLRKSGDFKSVITETSQE